MAGDTSGWECPHYDFGMRPQTGTKKMSEGIVTDTNIGSRFGGGALSFSGVAGSPLPVNFPVAPVLPVEGHQLDSLQVAVVRVDGTPAVDTSRRKRPRDERNLRRPSDASLLHGCPGSLCVGGGGLGDVSLPGSYWKSPSSCAIWGPSSGWCSEPCWPRWPSCCRWPCWPV